ncbi:unnamed protein product [Tetraodon nigroviridis]|uniref:(spotted green pufferfish) hypothetical protein n=1 Tax=Tetraodon nigroviridis TaxID=99883 RepID=Q4TJ58_TETNG|nr:unnamed protein product [Tetraodon nigroviridis]
MQNAEVLLRDQFVENVLEGALRRELKQLVRRQPTVTLLEGKQHQVPWVHISEDLSWTTNTASLAKKAQQRLYFLCKLKRARMSCCESSHSAIFANTVTLPASFQELPGNSGLISSIVRHCSKSNLLDFQ